MKILLHTCCSCCLIYPLEKLTESKNEVALHFYNPNIHPTSEYLSRYDSVKKYSSDESIELIAGEYEPEKYFKYVVDDLDNRCLFCYKLRLENTAKVAVERNFDAISTTLLISIYQKHEQIAEIGNDIAEKYGIKFIYEDFRPYFNDAQSKSKELGMYRQKYCGCIFSEKERYQKKLDKIL